MNRSCASLLHGSILALAAACALQCARDVRAQTSPPPGKALVILYRADKQPVAARVPVIANADRLGSIGNGEHVNAVVNPGRTFLRVGDRILTTLAIQTSANRTSYVLIEAVPGLTPVRVEMREMTEASARRALAQSRPAGGGTAAAAPLAPAPRAAAAAPAVAAAASRTAPLPPAAAKPKPAPPPPRQSTIAREPVAAEEEEEDAEAELHRWRFAIIPKAGVVKLATTSQTLGGVQASYDKTSKPALGLELEFRHLRGFAVGAEVLYYKNDLTVPGAALAGDQTVFGAMFNGKYYFGGESGRFHPFLGAGVGFSSAKFGGDFQGSASGPAFQGMLGVDYRFGDIGVYLEYKYLSSTASDSANQKIKTGGSGILAGMSIAF
ncbi:MAG TPA: outer membrane beta-barrel protein [Burkholderiales bacterium]|nr:outer membrane beta-barrel protein [Burkholderiales bacterium]